MIEYLGPQTALIDAALNHYTPAETEPPANLHKAMRYSLFAGGKRIRPILFLAAAEVIDTNTQDAPDAACTLELIHTYSLIHDDLPAIDNDDLRRGRPTCHKVFGEAMAILAGDALLTLAFQVLARLPNTPPATKATLIDELATASGTVRGMIGGQVHDIEGEGKPPTPQLLEAIHRAKTGALLKASVRMGAILAGASPVALQALSDYGDCTGLAFQIVDDILDVEQPSEILGKTAGKDAAQGKITFPAVYGLQTSHAMAKEELAKAHAALQPFDNRAQKLHELADLIGNRKA